MSTKSSHNATFVIDRLKVLLNAKTDTELAEMLDVDRTVIANWKRRGSVNSDKIISKCHNYDLNYIFTGTSLPANSDIKTLSNEIELTNIERWELENLNKQVILLRQRIDMLKNPPKVRDGNKFTLIPGAYTDEHYIKALEEQVYILKNKIKALEEE